MSRRPGNEPLRVVGAQAVATVAAAAVAAIWGADAAKAAFIGGAVVLLPNAYFACAGVGRLGRQLAAQEQRGEAGRREAGRRAQAEAALLLGRWGVKLALTVALLAFAIVVAGVGGGAFFAGLGLASAAQFAAPLVARRRQVAASGGR